MLLSAPLFVGVLSIAGVGASRHPHPPNGLTLSALDSTDCPGSSQALDKGDTIIDANHPKYFVEVSEISTRGTRRLIHAARSAADRSRMICQHINANVDIASKIGIRDVLPVAGPVRL